MEEYEPLSDWKSFPGSGGSIIIRKFREFVPYCTTSHMPQESRLHTALNCVFLSCMFFDIWGIHCGEYHVVFYCPELLSLLTKSDPHTQNTVIIKNLMFSYKTCLLLDTIEKLRKTIISFVMSVCPSAMNTSASTERIFTKLGVSVFFENLSRKFKFH